LIATILEFNYLMAGAQSFGYTSSNHSNSQPWLVIFGAPGWRWHAQNHRV